MSEPQTTARRILIRRADVLAAVVLCLLPLIMFWPQTLGGKTLLPADNLYQYQPYAAYRAQLGVPDVPHNSLLSDLVLENMIWKQFTRDSLRSGEIPLWNPYLFGGVPFLAAGQHSMLYPFSILYLILPLESAYGWFTVSQLFLAGVFMLMLLRGLGLGTFAALYGGITFQLSGFFLASVVFQMIIAAAAWLPFLILMCEFTLRRQTLFGRPTMLPWVIAGALGLGMCILAGHAEFMYYALLICGLWSAMRLIGLLITRQETFSVLIGRGMALIALVGFGIGVGAVQFIPFVELANNSFREGRSTFEQVLSYAYPPRHVLGLLMPNIWGSPSQHSYFDLFSNQHRPLDWVRSDGVRVTDTFMPGGKNYVEGAYYVGILTLILVAIALYSAIRERADFAKVPTRAPYRLLFGLLALLSLLFIFGTPAYALLYYGLPGFRQLHSPFRWVFPLTLCLAALAAYGAESLLRARGEKQHGADDLPQAGNSRTFRAAKWIGYSLIGVGGLLLVGLLTSRALYDQLQGIIALLYEGLDGANLAYPTPEVFYSVKFREVLIFALMLIASGCVVRVSRCPIYFRRIPAFQIMAIVTVALDLMLASWNFNPSADPKWLNFEPPSITWLKNQGNPNEWRLTTYQVPNTTATLNANIPWWHGLQDIRGYDSIILRGYVTYMNNIAPQDQLIYNRIAPLAPHTAQGLDSPHLDALSVRFIATEGEIDTAAYPHIKLAYRDEALRIYENTKAYPRALVVIPGMELCGMEGMIPIPALLAGSAATLIEAKGSQLQFEVSASGEPALLVVFDTYAPGWRAYVRPKGSEESAEVEAEVVQVYDQFRGVLVPVGESIVRLRYSPPSFQVGAFGTFLSLASLGLLGMIWAWRNFYRESSDESGKVRRFAKNSLAPIALNLYNRLIDLAFAFIMLRLLGPANAGIYYYAVVIFGWFDILTNFGLNTWLTREVARNRANAGRLLLNSSLLRLGLAVLGIPLLIGFLVVRSALQPPLDSTAIAAIVLLYLGLIPNSISTGLTALLYAYEKAELPAAVATITVILKSAAGLLALVAGLGVVGLAGVSIVLNVATLVMLWVAARDNLKASLRSADDASVAEENAAAKGVSGPMMRAMLSGGFPLMINHLLATIFFKIDVVLLEPLQGATVVGQYSTAYKWVDALGVIPALFTMALLPIMARQAHEDKPALLRNYQFAVKLLFSLALPTAVITTCAASFLVSLLGGARFLPDGAIALQIMIWFIPLGWINSLTNYVLIALDQQVRMRWAFVAGASFNVIANLLLIPIFSYRASAAITILSELVLLIGFYLLLRKVLAPIRWLSLLAKPVLAAIGMTLTALALWPVAPLAALLVAVIVYAVLLIMLRPFEAWEVGRMRALLSSG